MGLRRKRLYGPAALTGSATTVYTVPAATRTQIRHIHVSTVGGDATVTFSIGFTNPQSGGTRIYDDFTVNSTTPLDLWDRYTMEAGEIFQVRCLLLAASGVTITIDGDEYTL